MTGGKKRARVGAPAFFLGTALLCLIGTGRQGSSGEGPAQKSTLDNGLTVILDIDESSPTTILQILVKGGKRAEPAGKRGLSFLTTRLSVEIPDSSKVQELMSLATRFSVTALADHSLINIECLTENLDASLKVLSKIILDPLFSGIRIEAVKEHMEHQGRIEEDDSVRLGHLAGLGAFFAGTPYEGSIYGDKESLKAIKNRDVADFYGRYFIGPNIVLSLSSDLPGKTLLDLVGKYFAKIPKGEPVSFEPVSASDPKERAIHTDRDTKQTYVCLAYRLPEVSPRNFALATLLENLLGKGPGSRLWPLRTEKKLAYNVSCRATQMQSGGVIEAYLETDNSKMETAKAVLRQTILDLYQNGLSEEELAHTKTAAIADFIRENETKSGKVATLAYFESVGLGLSYFSGLSSEIGALTLDQVNAFIRSTLAPEKALEVVIGSKPGEE
ncbi:MAG TPA: pitrilysin family protein [Candidatus Desulfaltia sp.]|nr:pitrilysin family protein [Candidatus Desulfaltia sp.]